MKFYLFIFTLLISCNAAKKSNDKPELNTKTASVVAINGALSVKGNQVVNAKGKAVSFAGNSFFWSNKYYKGVPFYNEDIVKWLKKDWNTSIIRLPLAADSKVHDSYIYNEEENEQTVSAIVDVAIKEGLYVIIDWHSHDAYDYEKNAVKFFTQMAKKYGKSPNVIYEIYNEPLKVSWADVVKPYSEKVIAAIRKIDPDNIIVVGSPHWSQDVDIASENPIKGYKNIAYTLHFYAGSHKEWLMNKAKKALDNGIALIVTEWGTVNADGNGAIDYESTEKWIAFMKERNLINCNWSVYNKDEGASIAKPGTSPKGNWTDDELTASGKLVKSYIKNWGK